MERDRAPERDKIEYLLRELGYSLSWPPNADEAALLDHNVLDLALVELDGTQTRILDRSMQWIRFLEGQADELTSIASRLHTRLAASGVFREPELATANGESEADRIDRLEWTLAALEWWIEEQKPSDDEARFWVRWTPEDGFAVWVSGDHRTEPASLRAVVADAAEIEGGFSSESSTQVAAAVVAGLRSGEVSLLRMRRIEDDSRRQESVFELIPRGEGYKTDIGTTDKGNPFLQSAAAAMAATEEAIPVLPPEAEVTICQDDLPLAAFLDHASYATAGLDVGGVSHERGLEADLIEVVGQIAKRCHLQRKTVVRCLLSLVHEQLEAAARAGDHNAVLRLGRALRAFATFVLHE